MLTGNVPVIISCLHYEWETVAEAFDRCANEFGLDGIEFSLHPDSGHPHLPEDEYDLARELAEESGLRLSAHVWDNPAQLGAADAAERLLGWLDVAREVGFRHVIVHGGSHNDQWRGIEITREALASIAPEYEAAGVILCLENHYAYDYREQHELFSTSEEFRAALDAIDSPAVAFCLDYGHSHMTGNTLDLLERVGHRLAYTHLADNMGEHDDHLAFGRGTVPWREVLAATRAAGFRGPFTVEFPVRGDHQALRQCLNLLEEVYSE